MKKENGNDMPFKADEVNWDELSGIGIMKDELELSRMGKSLREIASQVGCGKSTVGRVIHRSKENENAIVPSVPPSQPIGERDMGQDGTPCNIKEKEA